MQYLKKKNQSNLSSFPRQTIQYHSNPICTPTTDAEEAEVHQLERLLELTTKYIIFIIGNWNAKVGSQGTPGLTGKFVLGVQTKAGQRLSGFCQENILVIGNTLFQLHKR